MYHQPMQQPVQRAQTRNQEVPSKAQPDGRPFSESERPIALDNTLRSPHGIPLVEKIEDNLRIPIAKKNTKWLAEHASENQQDPAQQTSG
jgi:hypothetical protein